MSNLKRTGTGRIRYFDDTAASERERYDLAVANGWRVETCEHGVTWRSRCTKGCDDPQIPTPIRASEDGAR